MSFSSWLRSWKSLVTPRKGTVRSPQTRHKRKGSPLTTRPCLEALEDRSLPSAAHALLADIVPPSAGAAAAAPQQLPFKENLTVVSVSPTGVVNYEGNATYFGHVTAVLNPDNTFTKTAANGDTASGYVTHASATKGTITITSGTGRFQGATGTSDYVISVDPHTGATSVEVTGTISYSPSGQTGGPADALAASTADSRVVPFKVTGGGPAPSGLPLTPGVTVPHQATGTATHLGKYTGEGTFTLGSLNISPTGQVTGTFQGTFVFVAANGARLAMTYGDGFSGRFTGQVSADGTAVVNVTFDAIFTPDPQHSTGRFASVTGGGFRMIANADYVSLISGVPGFTAPFDYTWSGEGSLVFSQGK
jgi:hypothetical protein